MWSISVEFLRGACVATTDSDRTVAEWPPHPARLFMSIAAAYFETREQPESALDTLHRNALQWIEAQSPPTIYASAACQRENLTVFVPVNDSTKTAQLLPEKRSRQPRYFPTSVPDESVIHYIYPESPPKEIMCGFESLLPEVIRIGHSSSLVRVWMQADAEQLKSNDVFFDLLEWRYSPNEMAGAEKMRVACADSLKMLETCYNGTAIDEFAALSLCVVRAKGKSKKELKQELVKNFPLGQPTSLRPTDWRTVYYNNSIPEREVLSKTCFDSEMMVLSILDGPALGLETTLQLAGALRKKIHDQYPDRKSPEWLGGHQVDGTPSTKPHMAIVPLPYVGSRHADGHLLGVGLVFPSDIPDRKRVAELSGLFYHKAGEEDVWLVDLDLPAFGRVSKDAGLQITMNRLVDQVRANALQASTWGRAARVWETTTPIVLDRYPKNSRLKNRLGWQTEVEKIISTSCRNIGAPEPQRVTVNHNAFISGVPSARPEKGGFPAMPNPNGGGVRFHVHARIEFKHAVQGPVILGAGRFVGYGLCRPAYDSSSQGRLEEKFSGRVESE